ncbi:MAG: methyltransferase domain-containing protein [Elusimicrobia bacterium]|nr:methyltransferase domain-containing protein [Elusimicrobiota bacterium]
MKEHEIRPEALLKRYVELSARDAETCFKDAPRTAVPCVACGGGPGMEQFAKHGFAYQRCAACGTLYQSPRPSVAAYEAFYRRSESSRYWAEVFYPAVAEVRREKIFRPRVERLAAMCAERGFAVDSLIDAGAGYGVFLDEWRQRFPQTRLTAVEPSESLAKECRAKGFTVVEEVVENAKGLEGSADLVTCFEVLEHVHDPLAFVQVLKGLAKPGGRVFVSTLGIDGFDLSVLWERSTQISPPHHINFLSLKGFARLFERAGLSDVVVTTPGRLDVDIVRNAAKTDPSLLEEQRFLRALVEDEAAGAAFQGFLAANRLSSHAWVMGTKP